MRRQVDAFEIVLEEVERAVKDLNNKGSQAFQGGNYEQVKAEYISRQRMGRLGTPEEIADGVLFLVLNEFCTGVSLLVDGGMCM